MFNKRIPHYNNVNEFLDDHFHSDLERIKRTEQFKKNDLMANVKNISLGDKNKTYHIATREYSDHVEYFLEETK